VVPAPAALAHRTAARVPEIAHSPHGAALSLVNRAGAERDEQVTLHRSYR